jgi:hypothetical protein
MTKRAAVLIGVRHPGGLPPLQAVDKCLQEMKEWADDQHIDRIEVLSDADGPVTAHDVKAAVRRAVDAGDIDQLIVYFSGHGVNIRYGEYWLLSDAPIDTQAAVNVEGSVVLARQCGIPHVIFISDACRTAAEGIQAQYITGSEIFPNTGPGGPEKCVDLFFASTLGKPALEIRDPDDAAKGYRAIYTDTLVEALRGRLRPPLETSADGKGFVRPRPLKSYLRDAVSKRLLNAKVNLTISQVPDARITSDDNAWVAEIDEINAIPPPPIPAAAPGRGVLIGFMVAGAPAVAPIAAPYIGEWMAPRRAAENAVAPMTACAAAEQMLQAGLAGNPSEAVPDHVHGGALLDDAIKRAAKDYGPQRFESHCGFRSFGKTVSGAWSRNMNVEVRSAELVRVNGAPPAQNVLLEFADGSGVVLPAIAEFIGTLVFDDEGDLENVTYEPAENSWRWTEFANRREQLRRLRGIIAASARLGVFHLESADAGALAREIQYSKTVDPTMAVYAAYAYHDLQQRDRMNEMQSYLRTDLGFTFFDLALLTRELGPHPDARSGAYPFYPMLAQGWALLSAYDVNLDAALTGIERHIRPGLWTTFDPEGVEQLRSAMKNGEVE